MSALLKNEQPYKTTIVGEALITASKPVTSKQNAFSVSKKRTIVDYIPAFGLLCALVSTFFGSIQAVIVRLLSDLHSVEILFIRFGFQFIVFSIVAIVNNYQLFGPKNTRLFLAFRCIAGTISLSSIYVAFRLIPIADAITINFSSPIIVIIIAYFVFKEPITIVKIFTVIFTLVGVIFIAKPEFLFGKESETVHLHRLEGTLLAVIGAIGLAVTQIFNQKIKSTPVAINVMWFSLVCTLSGITIVYMLDELVLPTDWRTCALLFGCGICGVCEMYLLTNAFRYEKAGPISVATTFNIVFAFIWSTCLLSERPEWTSIVGAGIISSCIVILGLQKWRTENPSQFHTLYQRIFVLKSYHDSNNNDNDDSAAKFITLDRKANIII